MQGFWLLLQNVFRSWRTTAIGAVGFVVLNSPDLLTWLNANTELTPAGLTGLLLLLLGAFGKDANKSGVIVKPEPVEE